MTVASAISVAVLCVCESSPYWGLQCDPWDAQRDALNFRGPGPIVAHPPCRLFGKLRQFVKDADESEVALALHCVEMVRQWGGVLEHPAYSRLWDLGSMPRPGALPDEFGGWTLAVSQRWFGHRADKPTWLYIVGVDPSAVPATPFELYGAGCVPVEFMGKAERERTPLALATWLLEVAARSKGGRA